MGERRDREMDRNPNRRQKIDILKQGERIGELLGLEKVPTFCMAWKEPRLDLPGGGDCYPLVNVLERLAEMAVMLAATKLELPKKKGGRPKKKPEVKTELHAEVTEEPSEV